MLFPVQCLDLLRTAQGDDHDKDSSFNNNYVHYSHNIIFIGLEVVTCLHFRLLLENYTRYVIFEAHKYNIYNKAVLGYK